MSVDLVASPADSCMEAAGALFALLDRKGQKIVFAESCTGGLAAAAITAIAGSSRVFWGGIVSYSEEAKASLLDVPQSTMESCGVVSSETAAAMAKGALLRAGTEFAAAVTGYAGPDAPMSEGAPGRVCFAWAARAGALRTAEERFTGGREAVRLAACRRLLEGSLSIIDAR